MKVESKLVAKVFEEIKMLLCGMDDVFQMGESVEECCQQIALNINTVINVFALENMTPVIVDKKYPFLRKHDDLHSKEEDTQYTMSWAEQCDLFKARFYHFLKREIVKLEIPVALDKFKMVLFFEETISFGHYEKYFQSHFEKSMYLVLDLVADEVIEHRLKHPQMALDLSAPKVLTSKSLIDIIL